MPSRFFPMYNIDQPVGPGKPNKADDVRLVQALLILMSRFMPDVVTQLPVRARTLATTATFDDTLEQWILAYQRYAAKWFKGYASVKVDGVIDPMPRDSPNNLTVHFKSGRLSTLAILCWDLWKSDRKAYLAIGDDYRIPWVPSPSAS